MAKRTMVGEPLPNIPWEEDAETGRPAIYYGGADTAEHKKARGR